MGVGGGNAGFRTEAQPWEALLQVFGGFCWFFLSGEILFMFEGSVLRDFLVVFFFLFAGPEWGRHMRRGWVWMLWSIGGGRDVECC